LLPLLQQGFCAGCSAGCFIFAHLSHPGGAAAASIFGQLAQRSAAFASAPFAFGQLGHGVFGQSAAFAQLAHLGQGAAAFPSAAFIFAHFAHPGWAWTGAFSVFTHLLHLGCTAVFSLAQTPNAPAMIKTAGTNTKSNFFFIHYLRYS
jgi:hypothetical protein